MTDPRGAGRGTDLPWIPTWGTRAGRGAERGGRRDPSCVRTGRHPPLEERSQLHQQQVLHLRTQVKGDALGLGLALGDDLQG